MKTKHCPICNLDLPIGEFGICRARKDGRNLYCKADIRKKVYASRQALKEHKAAQKRVVQDRIELQPEISTITYKLAPVDRVRLAIQNGARTQAEIGRGTRLGKDEIGDAIANLLLWTREIKTKVVEGTRMYFINEVEEPKIVEREADPFFDVARKANELLAQGEKKIRRAA